jgi:hypothetical protein
MRTDEHLPPGLDAEAALDEQQCVLGDAWVYRSHCPFS